MKSLFPKHDHDQDRLELTFWRRPLPCKERQALSAGLHLGGLAGCYEALVRQAWPLRHCTSGQGALVDVHASKLDEKWHVLLA